jgi:mRNA-degrading endonuclease RelE of RelBE toxin-antitoxin system
MSTLITVAEVDPFATTAARAGLSEDEREQLIIFLARNPAVGDLIPGSGGLRKLRWAGKGKGKRGGYRVIYYYFNEALPVYLLAVYPKNQQVDLTPHQKARLISLGAALKAEALKRARARRVPRRG